MRSLLVITQVTISFVLLICAGLTVHSLYNLLSVDPKFKSANVLSMQISVNWTKYQRARPPESSSIKRLNACKRRRECRALRLVWPFH
jgi:hypothetical protein